MLAQRKVNQLQLKANTYADLQKASLLIEDALHTASFTGLPANGLVLIRRLSLGRIGMANNSTAFSQRIDQRLLALSPSVISVGNEEQPGASIVWFADIIEANVLLARLLSHGISPISWYWRLAVPEWYDQDDTQVELITLLETASQGVQGKQIVSGIIERLLIDDRLDSFLDSVSIVTVRAILTNMNLDFSLYHNGDKQNDDISEIVFPVSHRWCSVIKKWIDKAGGEDCRCQLLAFSAAMEMDFNRSEYIATVIMHQMVDTRDLNLLSSREHNHDHLPVESKKKKSAMKKAKDAINIDTYSQEYGQVNLIQKEKQDLADTSIDAYEPSVDELNPLGMLSDYAGLPMLINVLHLLGIEKTLAEFPQLYELNLSNRVLWHCVKRVGIESNDICCQWLTDIKFLPVTKEHCPFIMPLQWMDLLFNRHRAESVVLRGLESDKHRHLMFDSSGKILLANWRGKMPTRVAELVKNRNTRLLPPLDRFNDLQQIGMSYLFAIRRYLYCYVNMGMHRLVRRTGRVAVSKTHVDIYLPMTNIDFDIRNAGLDLDPGWVQWMGRVMLFHYRSDEL